MPEPPGVYRSSSAPHFDQRAGQLRAERAVVSHAQASRLASEFWACAKALEQRVQVACSTRIAETAAIGVGGRRAVQVVGPGRRLRCGCPAPP